MSQLDDLTKWSIRKDILEKMNDFPIVNKFDDTFDQNEQINPKDIVLDFEFQPWIHLDTLEKILKSHSEELFAFSTFKGFPKQDIDWGQYYPNLSASIADTPIIVGGDEDEIRVN